MKQIWTAQILLAAAAMAEPMTDWLVYRPEESYAPAFGVQNWPSADGVHGQLISTLVMGESRTGILATEPFEAPETLTFWLAGHSNQQKNEVRLVDAGTGEVLQVQVVPGLNEAQRYTWDNTDLAGRTVRFEIVDGDSGHAWAWIALGRMNPEVAPMPRDAVELPEGWTERDYEEGLKTVDGIPKRMTPVYIDEEGDTAQLEVPEVRARYAYVFTGLNIPDEPNPAWGGGDGYRNFFIGDSAGDLALTYASGAEDVFPLVFGYTMWWRASYGFASAPFSTDQDARVLLDEALCVANGADAWQGGEEPFYLRIALRDEPLVALEIRDNPEKVGHASFNGMTFGQALSWHPAETVEPVEGDGPSEARMPWLESHTLCGDDPWAEERRAALESIREMLYTFPHDITHEVVAATVPDYDRDAYTGPSIEFRGPPEATIFTRTGYDSAIELLGRIEDDGMVHESHKNAPNFGGYGTWRPDLGPFYDAAYTRNRSMVLLARLGFQDRAENVVDFFNRWVMYFPESYPDLQLGRKPVPGHSTVIANQPHVYFDVLRHHGWPTKYTTRDFGNPENDGHGFLMLGHWRTWIKTGRSADWVRTRWDVIHEAAEYIPWCLDNPELSFSEHGLLYSESEGGMAQVTLYCNVPLYYGLLAYARMAESVGEDAFAERWRSTAGHLMEAMEDYLVREDGLWDPDRAGSWEYEQGVLAPILFGGDFHGWDTASRLPDNWYKRTLLSYEEAKTRMRPEWCASQGFGYGQGYYTQAALLFDKMNDADPMLRWMARFCFAPRLPHPYRVPEGATIAEDYSIWRRWGDLGNLYQMNEASQTVQVMVGVDDTDTETLAVMPRVPASWDGMSVAGYPARAMSEGASATVELRLDLEHNPKQPSTSLTVGADASVDRLRLRLGPLPKDARDIRAERDGELIDFEPLASGDSVWAWVSVEEFQGADESFTAFWSE